MEENSNLKVFFLLVDSESTLSIISGLIMRYLLLVLLTPGRLSSGHLNHSTTHTPYVSRAEMKTFYFASNETPFQKDILYTCTKELNKIKFKKYTKTSI